jgi:hypothetical protein
MNLTRKQLTNVEKAEGLHAPMNAFANIPAYSAGMTAMAAPVRGPEGKANGVVTIAGPLFRLTEERMLALGPQVIATAAEIGQTSGASPLFRTKA